MVLVLRYAFIFLVSGMSGVVSLALEDVVNYLGIFTQISINFVHKAQVEYMLQF